MAQGWHFRLEKLRLRHALRRSDFTNTNRIIIKGVDGQGQLYWRCCSPLRLRETGEVVKMVSTDPTQIQTIPRFVLR